MGFEGKTSGSPNCSETLDDSEQISSGFPSHITAQERLHTARLNQACLYPIILNNGLTAGPSDFHSAEVANFLLLAVLQLPDRPSESETHRSKAAEKLKSCSVRCFTAWRIVFLPLPSTGETSPEGFIAAEEEDDGLKSQHQREKNVSDGLKMDPRT